VVLWRCDGVYIVRAKRGVPKAFFVDLSARVRVRACVHTCVRVCAETLTRKSQRVIAGAHITPIRVAVDDCTYYIDCILYAHAVGRVTNNGTTVVHNIMI
jgi:hypothetical protein